MAHIMLAHDSLFVAQLLSTFSTRALFINIISSNLPPAASPSNRTLYFSLPWLASAFAKIFACQKSVAYFCALLKAIAVQIAMHRA